MEIEFGFQANCSELVTHLGFSNPEAIARAMKKIQEFTGWSWWATDYLESYLVRVPMKGLEDLLVLDLKRGRVAIPPEKLLAHWKDRLTPQQLEELSSLEWLDPVDEIAVELTDTIKLLELPLDKLVRVPGKQTLDMAVTADLDIEEDIAEEEPDLVFMIADGEIGMMAIFHKLRKLFDSFACGFDGGKTDNYEDWMAYHFLQGETLERFRAYLENEKDYYDVSFLEKDLEVFRRNLWKFEGKEVVVDYVPPLEDSGQLDNRDFHDIYRRVLEVPERERRAAGARKKREKKKESGFFKRLFGGK